MHCHVNYMTLDTPKINCRACSFFIHCNILTKVNSKTASQTRRGIRRGIWKVCETPNKFASVVVVVVVVVVVSSTTTCARWLKRRRDDETATALFFEP